MHLWGRTIQLQFLGENWGILLKKEVENPDYSDKQTQLGTEAYLFTEHLQVRSMGAKCRGVPACPHTSISRASWTQMSSLLWSSSETPSLVTSQEYSSTLATSPVGNGDSGCSMAAQNMDSDRATFSTIPTGQIAWSPSEERLRQPQST